MEKIEHTLNSFCTTARQRWITFFYTHCTGIYYFVMLFCWINSAWFIIDQFILRHIFLSGQEGFEVF